MSAPLEAAPAVQAVVPAVDFDSLHDQARDALDRLREAQASRRVTLASASNF